MSSVIIITIIIKFYYYQKCTDYSNKLLQNTAGHFIELE